MNAGAPYASSYSYVPGVASRCLFSVTLLRGVGLAAHTLDYLRLRSERLINECFARVVLGDFLPPPPSPLVSLAAATGGASTTTTRAPAASTARRSRGALRRAPAQSMPQCTENPIRQTFRVPL
ncbi:hypothetical protein DPEC_G00298350 [Dallia pectoralis]|uniref:Uncharacterized protein n=1 Tax=Dallia pectoralis TaxID=75939 RepID=A0ACC2FFX9_DALPE|nr:hypothetical protein DPEC_G00298350 [Dallia pectoralis]